MRTESRMAVGSCLLHACLLVSSVLAAGTFQQVLPGVVAGTKKFVLPVLCREPAWPPDSVKYGTGVVLGSAPPGGLYIAVLTCEHVVRVGTDPAGTPTYASQVAVNMNNQDGSVFQVPGVVTYADTSLDVALVTLALDGLTPGQLKLIRLSFVAPSMWRGPTALSEGEQLLYIGYPMQFGLGSHNYPVARTGIVSQSIPDSSYFLMDGFAQHGHSGSPVFVIREEGNRIPTEWSAYLVGVTTSFPGELGDILQKIAYQADTLGLKAELNPGFTYCTRIERFLPALERLMHIEVPYEY